MIPLGDASRRPANFPIATAAIIAVNAVVFLLELMGGDDFVQQWSLVPADIVAGHHLITILTSMFMHASWSHIIGNMIFLWAFGPEIEDAMGTGRYTAFYFAGGVVSMLAQVAVDPGTTLPSLGASGAIAAVMGAFLVTYPSDQIRTILIFGWFYRVTFIPAALLIGFWFLIQLVSFGVVADVQSGGVAYMAHIGGMIFGAVTAGLFEHSRRPPRFIDLGQCDRVLVARSCRRRGTPRKARSVKAEKSHERYAVTRYTLHRSNSVSFQLAVLGRPRDGGPGHYRIVFPMMSTLVAELMVGWMPLFSGSITLWGSFSIHGTGPFFGAFLLGLLSIATGVFLLFHPLAGVMALTLLVAFILSLQGAVEVSFALSMHPVDGWVGVLVSGLASLVLAVVIAAGWPANSIVPLGIILGVNFLTTGLSNIFLSRALKA